VKVEVAVPDFRRLVDGIEGKIARAATEAMRETTPAALAELRVQTTGAGLGQRLANTWRDRVYPESRQSMTPTGYIWSNAPRIADAFARGATIRPLAGKRFLWIPTESVPLGRGRYSGGRGKRLPMTPEEVETAFDQDLHYRRGRRGSVLAFANVVRGNRRSGGRGQARTKAGFRPATKGRLARGRETEEVLMFTLVPSVTLPKLFDLDGVAQRWSRRFDAAFIRRLDLL